MRLGVVRQRYVAAGGAERYLHALVEEFSARGHEVILFARSWLGETDSRYRLCRVPAWGGGSFLKALSFAFACRHVVAKHSCDVVLSLERTLRQDVYRAGDGCHVEWLAQRARYQSRARRTLAFVSPLHVALRWLERRTFSSACTRRVIANSHRGREEILRHFHVAADRVDVVLNGVDLERYRPRPGLPTGSTLDLLFVGSGWERKGLRFALEALARLPAKYRLRVAGRGNVRQYGELAARLGVLERTEFLGPVGQMETLYPEARLLVHPAIYEPFGNVCLEAMACGVPIVTSRINGASELIDPGRNGSVVENPADVSGWVDAIRRFEARDLRMSAAVAARATAERHPLAAKVTQTLRILERVAEEREAKRR